MISHYPEARTAGILGVIPCPSHQYAPLSSQLTHEHMKNIKRPDDVELFAQFTSSLLCSNQMNWHEKQNNVCEMSDGLHWGRHKFWLVDKDVSLQWTQDCRWYLDHVYYLVNRVLDDDSFKWIKPVSHSCSVKIPLFNEMKQELVRSVDTNRQDFLKVFLKCF